MAISASVDSDICRWAATAANIRFSGGVGRAVIDGAIAFEAPSFTARLSVSKNHLATLLAVSDNSSVMACMSSFAGP